MALTVPPLAMSASQLDSLYMSSPPGDIPVGRGNGTVVFKPGTRFSRPLAAVARLVLWQGKVFRPGTHDLVNLLTPFGRPSLRAEVRHDASRLTANHALPSTTQRPPGRPAEFGTRSARSVPTSTWAWCSRSPAR